MARARSESGYVIFRNISSSGPRSIGRDAELCLIEHCICLLLQPVYI
jgi:hypothetical protein